MSRRSGIRSLHHARLHTHDYIGTWFQSNPFSQFSKDVLNQVADGELSARVPIASNDEFGIIATHTNHTIETLEARTEELAQMRDVTILALASLAETRDNETGAHILRTQHM